MTVYKFLDGGVPLARLCDAHTLRFTPPRELNDPFESAIDVGSMRTEFRRLFRKQLRDLVDWFGASQEDSDDYFNSIVWKSVLDSFNRYGILSLSGSRDSLLLWAHYAKSHQGVAVGLDASHDFFSSEGRGVGGYQGLRRVVYSTKRLAFGSDDESNASKNLKDIAFHKSVEWSYEDEYRMIADLEESDRFVDGKIRGVVEFPAELIQSITLGAQAPMSVVEQAFQISERQPHILIQFATFSSKEFALKFRNAPSLDLMRRIRPHAY